jgi:uncharacterized membrane protein YcaP (DUF421 family)
MNDIFDWNRLLLNDLPIKFLWEVIFRSAVMFLLLLVLLRFTGKRGIKQLSVFEMGLIIALGSAAGDPMFYEDVGILPALTVFVIIVLLYRLVTFLSAKNKAFETFVEGKTVTIIEDGKFSIDNFEKETLAQDEFFLELRLKSIEHLGQIKSAFLETNGEISVFYYPDDAVKYGLPILPKTFGKREKDFNENGFYSCTFCGTTEKNTGLNTIQCQTCSKNEWVAAINTIRIT